MRCIRHKDYNRKLFEGVEYTKRYLTNHQEVFRELLDKRPYIVTVLIENLDPGLWRRKEYCKQIHIDRPSRYIELLYKMFHSDFSEQGANQTYQKWLEKYRPRWLCEHKNNELDAYIIKNELEPRYKTKILRRFSNHKEIFKPRYRIETERYYNLPLPFNHIDWRNPYDNIFIWHDGRSKLAVRGGSGSSWQRQINSAYLYGYACINKHAPIPSFLFIYDRENLLWFIRRSHSLYAPIFDLGSNYQISPKEERRVLDGVKLFRWEPNQEPIKEITVL